MDLPASVTTEIERCTLCGKCRSVCPVFEQTLGETTNARGRIRLLQAAMAGDLPVSRRFELAVSTCLRCLRCQSVCPASLRIDEITLAARARIVGPGARYALGRFAARLVLPHRRAFSLAASAVRGLRRLSGAVPPMPGGSAVRRWAGTPIDGSPRIGLFVGCLLDTVYPDVIEAVLDVCRRKGVGVVVPKGQVCCGTPALALGDGRLAERLVRRNAEAFLAAGVTTLVTACGSCGQTMKDTWPRFAGRRWRDVRVLDFSEFAVEIGLPRAEGAAGRITYHDPCHLGFGQGVTEQPREVLRRTADLVEMDGADRCCGSGGLFQVFHRDESRRIGDVKADAVAACDAPTVATACPACMMQIEATLGRRGIERRVVHVASVLADAMRQGE